MEEEEDDSFDFDQLAEQCLQEKENEWINKQPKLVCLSPPKEMKRQLPVGKIAPMKYSANDPLRYNPVYTIMDNFKNGRHPKDFLPLQRHASDDNRICSRVEAKVYPLIQFDQSDNEEDDEDDDTDDVNDTDETPMSPGREYINVEDISKTKVSKMVLNMSMFENEKLNKKHKITLKKALRTIDQNNTKKQSIQRLQKSPYDKDQQDYMMKQDQQEYYIKRKKHRKPPTLRLRHMS